MHVEKKERQRQTTFYDDSFGLQRKTETTTALPPSLSLLVKHIIFHGLLRNDNRAHDAKLGTFKTRKLSLKNCGCSSMNYDDIIQ